MSSYCSAMKRRRSSTVPPRSGGSPAVMIRSGSPAACASIVEITRSNRIIPSPSRPIRRPLPPILCWSKRSTPIPSWRIRVQRSRETAPNAEAVSPMSFHEPAATLAEASALPAKLRFKLAAWLRVSGQFDDAARLLDLIEQESGETATLLDERAALALAVGNAEAVRACWQRRLASYPAPSARVSFARALLELGDRDEAAEIAEGLVAEHGELATVQSLAAEVALHQGDLATAHDRWSTLLADDTSCIAPQLAITRIAALGGDLDQARSMLSRALADPALLTVAQLASAAALADF